MKRILITLIPLLCCGLLFTQCKETPEVEPLHPELWDEIEEYVRQSWPDYVEHDPLFPAPYIYALNPGTLYYSDIYFINEGLLRSGYKDIARGNLDCLFFEIDSLGFVPNAIRWAVTRTQIPVLSMAVKSYYDWDETTRDTAWLRKAYKALLTEYSFWTNMDGNMIQDNRTPIEGLQTYSHHADTAEVIEFYDRVLSGRFNISRDVPFEEKYEIGDQRMAEAGCADFTPRFDGRIRNFAPICLNSFLCGYERDLGRYERELGITSDYRWDERADRRAELVNRYCWNEERGFYFDYDFVNDRHSDVASIVGYLPLYFGIASKRQADRMRDNLPLFDSDGGVVVCEVTEQAINYQHGHNAVWPYAQQWMILILEEYGYHREAKQIATKWLNTLTRNWLDPTPSTYPPFKYGDGTRHPGSLYEKYTREGLINDAEYPCSEMLGWAGSSFLVALDVVRK